MELPLHSSGLHRVYVHNFIISGENMKLKRKIIDNMNPWIVERVPEWTVSGLMQKKILLGCPSIFFFPDEAEYGIIFSLGVHSISIKKRGCHE
jgi:hypothetical protein